MAVIQIRTRAERRLPPYVSPKKDWDSNGPTVTVELLTPATSSQRDWRRERRRRFDANQRRATRQWQNKQRTEAHQRANAAGLARVYLNIGGCGQRNPQMWRNTTHAVNAMVKTMMAKDETLSLSGAQKLVEGELLKLVGRDQPARER